MIRVLHIFPPGFGGVFSGANILWLRLARQSREPDLEHLVFLPEINQLVNLKYFAEHGNMSFKTLPRAIWTLRVLWGLIRLRCHYDIAHLHILDWAGLFAPVIIKLSGRVSVRESSLWDSDNPSAIARQRLSTLKITLCRFYDEVVCVSGALRDDALNYGLAAELIFNPVDTDTFMPVSSVDEKHSILEHIGLSTDTCVLLFVGSVKYRKGIDILIDAMAQLKFLDNLLLIIVGPRNSQESPSVDDRFVQAMETRIAEYNLGDKIKFVGRLEGDELLRQYYQAADIMVFPTRNEGLPNVLLEAMACGLPTIISHLAGATDLVIDDGKNGFLVPVEDCTAVANKVKLLIQDSNLRTRLGSNAREYVVKNHAFETWETKLARSYRRLLD